MAGNFRFATENEKGLISSGSFRLNFVVEEQRSYDVLFLFTLFALSLALRTVTRNLNLYLVNNLILMLTGMLIGLIQMQYSAKMHVFSGIIDAQVSRITLAVLPAVIFRTAYSLDAHVFLRGFWQIFLLGVVGFVISVLMVGTAMMYMYNQNLAFDFGLMFGAVACAISSYEVVILLKELGQSKHLIVLLQGESLLGSSAAIVMFTCIFNHGSHPQISSLDIFYDLMGLIFIGPLVGYFSGKLLVKVMPFFYGDHVMCTGLTFVGTYWFYTFGEEFGTAGVLSVLVMGVIVSIERPHFPVVLDIAISEFWDLVTFLACSFLYFEFGIVIFAVLYEHLRGYHVVVVVVTYMLCTIVRCFTFLCLAPIVSRIAYGLSWRNGLVGAWAGIRGPCSACLVLYVVQSRGMKLEGVNLTIHFTGLMVLTQLINGCTLQIIMKYLGMTTLSLAKKTNMNNAMKYIEVLRERSINMLKMDRFLADANWIVVDIETKIKHPYKISYDDDDDEDDNYLGYRFTTCPSCEKEILNEPTPLEFQEMSREAKLRILKAKKVSYWRQFEHGMISKDGVRLLVAAVDVAMDREDPVMEVTDISMTWSRKGPWNYIRKRFVYMLANTNNSILPLPQEKWRQWCYGVATSAWFDYLIYAVIIVNVIPIIAFLRSNDLSVLERRIHKGINGIFFLIYLVEFIIKVSAFRFKGYFKFKWNIFDFVILLISGADVVMDILDSTAVQFNKTDSISNVTGTTKMLRIIRLLRLVRLLRATVPRSIAFVDARLDEQMAIGYGVAKGFVTGEEEVVKILPLFVDNKRILDELKEKTEADRLQVIKELGMMQRDRPWIAITVKTRQGIRSVLNKLKGSVHEMKDGGLLDEVEYFKLMYSVDDQLKHLAGHLKLIEPCPPETLLKDVAWVRGDELVSQFIFDNATLVNFNCGDIVVSVGQAPDAMYILVSGMVKMKYIPRVSTLDNLEKYGALPNIDVFNTVHFDEKQEDYIVTGNVIGELGALTGRAFDETVSCETVVQAYKIPTLVMQEAFKLNDDISQGVHARMWKAVSIRIATVILLSVPAYQSWTQDKIKFHLERAFVPTLTRLRVFVVNDLMEDLLLIEGQVMDVNSRTLFKGPSYIPRTVNRLVFPRSSLLNMSTPIPTKLLIIPTKDVDEYDIMENEDFHEMVSTQSSRCSQHTAQSRLTNNSYRASLDTSKSRMRPQPPRKKAGWALFGMGKPKRQGVSGRRSSMGAMSYASAGASGSNRGVYPDLEAARMSLIDSPETAPNVPDWLKQDMEKNRRKSLEAKFNERNVPDMVSRDRTRPSYAPANLDAFDEQEEDKENEDE